MRGQPQASFVYFARCETFIKIGIAQDVYSRIKTLATASPWPVSLAAEMVGWEDEERRLHSLFSKLRHRNEWFREEGKLADLVAKISGARTPIHARAIANDWYFDHSGSIDPGALGGRNYYVYPRYAAQIDEEYDRAAD